MNKLAKYLPMVVAVVFALWLAGKAVPPRDEPGKMRVREFGRLPVVFQGRVKPYDTLARNCLTIIAEREEFTDELGDDRPAVEWLLDVISGSEAARGHKVFRIVNTEVLDLLGLEPRINPTGQRFRYSLKEIGGRFQDFLEQVGKSQGVEESQRDAFDNKVLELASKIDLYRRLQDSYAFPPIRPDHVQEDVQSVVERYRQLEQMELPHAVPPVEAAGAGGKWTPFMRTALQSMVMDPPPAYRPLAAILIARRDGDFKAFNRALGEYQAVIDDTPEVNKGRVRFEAWFNHFAPFYHCSVIYLVAFVVACFAWLGWSGPLNRAAFWLMVVALVVHTLAIAARVYMSTYPPITNLYGTAIFIGWACVVFGLALEALFKLGVGNIVASIAGFVTLLIAHILAGDGDTMEMMLAVLDTRFWLATHVIVINLGYAATFFAGTLASLYLLRGVLTRSLDKPVEQTLARMVYGILNFALLFSFVGTVLGGLWADDSWGRFWGWDPKENGALMIVLWNALILHARWGGLVKPRGIAVLAVFGNILTAWSWFGVNELGIGLHAYGFTEGRAFWLALYVLSQLTIMAIGLTPRRLWRSSTPLPAAIS